MAKWPDGQIHGSEAKFGRPPVVCQNSAASLMPKHLLLVEDEPALRSVVAEQLTDRGFEVDQADSGETALARLADFAYDAIITDLRMPGIGGSEVVEAA